MKKIALAMGLLAVSVVTQAETDRGVTVEGLIGVADQETTINAFSVDDSDTSLGLRLGFQINKYIAIEIAYRDYGEAEDSFIDSFGDNINDTVESDSIDFGVKGMLPLGDKFSLIGRVGMARWDYELSETDSAFPGEVFKVDDDGTDIYYGVGAQFNVTEQFFVTAEYTVLEMDFELAGVLSGEHEVKNLAISAGFKF